MTSLRDILQTYVAVTILLSQTEMAGPTPPALMRDFWRHAATA